ncbi:hypothetical protein D9619_001449 [Psilocybe cf. subviscida]|uniref:Uncharacterized protein n=1 Tax=Psilocybe cf. subviscida TaxID=2480587 RepID=A0A8H5F3J7_9AGAR|nr:hypothetical protein D9619_001449 [Psilocybe cf. subviscida]
MEGRSTYPYGAVVGPKCLPFLSNGRSSPKVYWSPQHPSPLAPLFDFFLETYREQPPATIPDRKPSFCGSDD